MMMHKARGNEESCNYTHETEFIRAFVIRQKRERFLEFVTSKKGRGKFTFELDHPNFISTEFTRKIVPAQQTAQAIYSLLRKSHAPDICYVISSNEEIDACQFPALDALRKTIGRGLGLYFRSSRANWHTSKTKTAICGLFWKSRAVPTSGDVG